MANLTITLKTQRVNCFGPAPSVKWGTGMTWGATPWGEKIIGAGNLPIMIASLAAVNYMITWKRNAINVSYANTNKREIDGRGYSYVFIDRVTNAESGVTQSYQTQAAATGSYSSLPAASTTWS